MSKTQTVLYSKEQAWELSLLALTIWREGQNQGAAGMLAIGWSIRNRVLRAGKTWWGDDWEEVILKPWQYTSMMASDPNAVKLPGDPSIQKPWADALAAAEAAYSGAGVNPIGDATHYYNPRVVAEPAWVKAPGSKFIKQVGDHRFYIAN